MRPLLPALAVALALSFALIPAAAQPPAFSEAFQVRGAVGDIPTTSASEPAGAWNLEQRFTLTAANGTTQAVTFRIPSGSTLVNATCTCGAAATTSGRDVTFNVDGGSHTLTVLSTQPNTAALAFDVQRPVSAGDGVVILYVPNGSTAEGPIDSSSPGSSTDGSARIVVFQSGNLPQPFWATIRPGTTVPGPDPTDDSDPTSDNTRWIYLALGVLAGILLWALLVQKGAVQRKARKQVVATAAHVEAAAAEPAPVLEGRKRALLAALKEVEVARMNNEMAPEVYDAVKADLKKQAVTVMRALETSKQD